MGLIFYSPIDFHWATWQCSRNCDITAAVILPVVVITVRKTVIVTISEIIFRTTV